MPARVVRRVLAVALLVAAPISALAQARSERLVTGEQKTFTPGYAVGDIAIANPQIADYRVVSNRRDVLLIANTPGFTTLTVWDQRGAKREEITIEVVSRDYAKLIADLTELVRPYRNVTVRSLGNRLVLAGTVNSTQELTAVRALASADNRILSTVTVEGAPGDPATAAPPRTQPTTPATPTSAGTAPAAPAPRPATPTIVLDPVPPPSTRPVVNAPAPVALTPATPSTAAPIAMAGAPAPDRATSAPPVAVPAVAAPPPPNVSAVTGERSAPRVGPPTVASPFKSSEPVSIEYQVELYESPSSGPPPEVRGPQGTRLYATRLRTQGGTEVQQVITVGKQEGSPANLRGIRVALTPTVTGAGIQTAVVIDTNLPLGQYDQKNNPVWLRSRVSFSGQAGQTRYITEAELARTASPTGAAPTEASGSNGGRRAAGTVVDAGTNIATTATGVQIPALGGLFGGGSSGKPQPKQRPTMLLIVVTPTLVAAAPR